MRGRRGLLNGEPIRCSDAAELATALVATGFSYDAAKRVRQAEVLVQVLGRVRDIRRFGAAAVDLCYVACGRVDAYYERGLAAWDLAAGELIAQEAGAVATGFDGGPSRPVRSWWRARRSTARCWRCWPPPAPDHPTGANSHAIGVAEDVRRVRWRRAWALRRRRARRTSTRRSATAAGPAGRRATSWSALGRASTAGAG